MPTQLETLLSHPGTLHDMKADVRLKLMGEVMELAQASNRHRHLTVNELTATTFPPIHFNQFRIYRDARRPIGWVSWAFMTDAQASGYMAGDFDFTIDTWIDGPHLWFVDFIAPYGHALKIAEDLRDNVFPDRVAYAPDLEDDTGAKRVRKFYGAHVSGADKADANFDFLQQVSG